LGHTAALRRVAFSPDGKLLASVEDGGTVKLWDVPAKKEHRTIRPDYALDLAFSPDGTRLAIAEFVNSRVTVWDTQSGSKLYSILSHTRPVTAVAFRPDGGRLAAAGGLRDDSDLSIRLWPGRGDPEATTFRGHTAMVRSAAFLPDGARVVSTSGRGSGPGDARLWDATTGQELRAFRGHTGMVLCATVSPDGKTLATGSADKTIRLWEIDTGRELHRLQGHKREVRKLAFSADGHRLASVAGGGPSEKGPGAEPVEVRLWELPGGRPVADIERPKGDASAVVFRPDGSQFAVVMTEVVATYDVVIGVPAKRTGLLTLHNAHDGRIERTLRLDHPKLDLSYTPDGRRLAVAGDAGHTEAGNVAAVVQEFDPEADTWRDLVPARSTGPVRLTFAPDGRRLATGNFDGTVTIWDLGSGRELLTLGRPSVPFGLVGQVAFSPDGSRLLAFEVGGGTVTVWDGTPKK
ncbi:MAG TPA: WD40 repeat domain-containing protein, partial [Gemmataceae bacterium]|nr:WD40 repeat domain-containing protein [Gemmataceae bacterium]